MKSLHERIISSTALDSTWICLDLEMPQRADPAERAMAELG